MMSLERPQSTVPLSSVPSHLVNADQTQTYEAVAADVVADVMRGFNGTVMAYGQTGAATVQSLARNL